MRVHAPTLTGFRGIRDSMGRDVLDLDFERLAPGAALVTIKYRVRQLTVW